jgi:tetratricopeptide (TPR) repeat protein
MKIFVSWSGPRSKAVAAKLRDWLPDIIQHVDPWMSAADIDAGARWSRTIDEQLSDTSFGIICLTRENLNSPWVLFEAGALAKTMASSLVCPYLIDLEPRDIPQGPLTQFQAKRAIESDTWELIQTINGELNNGELKERALPDDRLRRAFDRCWPDLERALLALPEATVTNPVRRTSDEMLAEVLELVRELARRSNVNEPAEESVDSISSLVQRVSRVEKGEQSQEYVSMADRLLETDIKRATNYYDSAIQLVPEYESAWIGKAKVHKRLGELDKAIEILNAIIYRNPGSEKAFYNRACYKCLANHDKEDVLADLRRAIECLPENRTCALDDPDFGRLRQDVDFLQVLKAPSRSKRKSKRTTIEDQDAYKG